MRFPMLTLFVVGLLSTSAAGFLAGRSSLTPNLTPNNSNSTAVERSDPTEQGSPLNTQNQAPQTQTPQAQNGCPIYLYKDGKLYQFKQPNGQDQPNSQGKQKGGQGGEGDDELLPVEPFNGPSPIPGLPVEPAPVPRRS